MKSAIGNRHHWWGECSYSSGCSYRYDAPRTSISLTFAYPSRNQYGTDFAPFYPYALRWRYKYARSLTYIRKCYLFQSLVEPSELVSIRRYSLQKLFLLIRLFSSCMKPSGMVFCRNEWMIDSFWFDFDVKSFYRYWPCGHGTIRKLFPLFSYWFALQYIDFFYWERGNNWNKCVNGHWPFPRFSLSVVAVSARRITEATL